MPNYSCYGLVIDSELPLPEALPSIGGNADLTLRPGPIATPEPTVDWVLYRIVTPSEVFVLYRGVGGALVAHGKYITYWSEPGVDPLVFRLFILQQVIGVALLQRQLFVLHASAAVIEGRALAFAGVSGQGKSTMSAALHALGGQILADDVLAVDLKNPDQPIALPGLSQLKLTEQTRAEIAPNIEAEQTIGGKRGKKLCAIRGVPLREGVPLAAIFLLRTGPEIEFHPTPPAQAAVHLVANTYGSKLLSHIQRAESHFRQCAALAGRIPITILSRPRDLSRLPEIARAVLEKIKPVAP